MKASSRANVASSFTVVKGALIDETYAVFAAWDFARTKRQNLDRLREENFIGASSTTWLRDVAKVLNRRFDPDGRDRALVGLAKNNCDLEEWKPLLLWHITRDEFLVRDFLQNWLFPSYDAGTFRVRPEELHDYLRGVGKRGGTTEHVWSETTMNRVAAGLLKMAVDFGLLRGSVVREFATYHLPERSFLYLLHAMREERNSPSEVVGRTRLAHVLDAASRRRARAPAAPPVPEARVPGRRQPRAALAALRELPRVRREDGCMSDLEHRIKQSLEPVLEMADPRQRISAYHDMPYALFRYDPEEEFELRKQVTLLETRLTQKGKRISRISLAECLDVAMRAQRPLEEWFAAEREQGVETTVQTVHSVLSEYAPTLVELVAARLPEDPDPLQDIVFILRTGALFPVYRTFSLLEQLKGRVHVPTVLFYPGDLDGAAGLRFMGVLDAEHNYRPKIF